jgi:hypothetical protein
VKYLKPGLSTIIGLFVLFMVYKHFRFYLIKIVSFVGYFILNENEVKTKANSRLRLFMHPFDSLNTLCTFQHISL